MDIALFADIHGRVELCFKLCARWQQETGRKLDYILQAGDLGAFFDEAHLDKATKRYAQDDPSELGFLQHFATYHPRTAAALSSTDCPMFFVRGNHEDHAVLDRLEQQHPGPAFPIDVYQRIWCLKSGIPHQLAAGQAALQVLGIGRIGPIDGVTDTTKKKYIQPYEQERIAQLGSVQLDLLLSHDSARNAVTPGYGLDEIRYMLDRYRPHYHVYGHTGEPYYQRQDRNGITLACKLADLSWDMTQGGIVNAGSMAILHWEDPERSQLEVVEAPWLKEYSRYSWEFLSEHA
jgi:hypothetical protein